MVHRLGGIPVPGAVSRLRDHDVTKPVRTASRGYEHFPKKSVITPQMGSGRPDSNRRHSAWKADTLPTELLPQRSCDRSPSGIPGRGGGTRTPDLSVPNAARYQLRYTPRARIAHSSIGAGGRDGEKSVDGRWTMVDGTEKVAGSQWMVVGSWWMDTGNGKPDTHSNDQRPPLTLNP